MFDRLEIFSLASAQARHAAARQAVVAQNIANSDTPGYRARDIGDFADMLRQMQDRPPGQAGRNGVPHAGCRYAGLPQRQYGFT
jgi:flagellar basal-body rod protein FlgB